MVGSISSLAGLLVLTCRNRKNILTFSFAWILLIKRKKRFFMKPKNKFFSISKSNQYYFSTLLMFIIIVILYNVQNSIGYETVSLILLLIIFLLPLFNFERGPIILSAVISAFAWDYYFIPPHFTMRIAKPEDAMMLFMFFIVAVTNGVLTSQLKTQKNLMMEKERKSNALYLLLKALSNGKDQNELLSNVVQQIENVFGFKSIIFFPSDQNKLKREAHPMSNFRVDDLDWLAAESSFETKRETGKSTDTLQNVNAKYFPLMDKDSVSCVIGIKISDDLKSDPSEMEFLRHFINEISPFIEKYV